MLYRVLRAINENYALAMLWLYIGAFVLAAPFLFIYPQVTLLIFLLALAGLGFVVGLGGLLKFMQRMVVRSAMRRRRCPRCRSGAALHPSGNDEWRCDRCGVTFRASGAEPDEATASE